MPSTISHELERYAPDRPFELLIAHSSLVTLNGLEAISGSEVDLKVAKTFNHFSTAVESAQECPPDILVTGLCFDGKCIINQLHNIPEKTQIIAFTDHSAINIVQYALNNRAQGYIVHSADPSNLSDAIRQVSLGHTYVDPLIGSRLLRKQGAGCLTAREVEVLRLFATGHTTEEIARQIHVSRRTAEACRSSLKRKLFLSSRSQMYLFAQANGYLTGQCSCLEESLEQTSN